MIDLKKTKQEIKDEKKNYATMGPGELDRYPWGTSLHFEKPIIDKIDVLKKGVVGEKVRISAVAKITNVSKNERSDGSVHHRVEIQLTKIDVAGAEKDMPEDEKSAFESKEM